MEQHLPPSQEENLRSTESLVASRAVHYDTNDSRFKFFKKISWGAIIAGVIVAIMIQFLFTLLGLGIGIGTIDPMEESQPFQGLGTGTLIWWIITVLISLFAGAWVAGRQCNLPEKMDRVLHGVLMWCLFTILSVYFFTSAVGSILGGIGSVIGKTLSLAGQGIQAVAPQAANYIENNTAIGNIDLQNIKKEAEQILRQSGKKDLQPGNLGQTANQMQNQVQTTAGDIAQNPMQAGQEINALIGKLVGEGKDVFDDADKEALVNVIVARTDKSRAEAEAQVNNWIAAAQNAKEALQNTKQQVIQQAKETGQNVADAVSKIAIFSFVGLILGAIVSGVGSMIVTPSYVPEVNEQLRT